MDIQIIAIKAAQLLLCLSLLVALHEGGHFFFAKLFGVKVEKFYLFFDYKFHLFSTRSKWFTRFFPRFKESETEYGIGWIPLGGYVKIAGMVDESLDTEQLKKPAQPDEFRSQAVWKRFCIMVGGVLVNLITAFALYSMIMFFWGEDRLPMRSIKDGFAFNAQAEALGFRDGDIPVRVDQKDIIAYTPWLMRDLSNARVVTVLRAGQEVQLVMPEGGLDMLAMMEMQPAFLTPVAVSQIDSVLPGSPAEQAGLVAGSRIVAIDGTPIAYWSDFDSLMAERTERKMQLVVQRPASTQPDTLALTLDSELQLGVLRHMPIGEEQLEHIEYGLLSSIPAGLHYGWGMLTGYVNDLKYVFTPKGAQNVGSFITIGSIFPAAWDWQRFWSITAIISIMLAVMNILPIPGLDGGHVVILLYEAVTGREPSERVMVWLEYVGLFFLISLMLLAFGNDIVRWILPHFQG